MICLVHMKICYTQNEFTHTPIINSFNTTTQLTHHNQIYSTDLHSDIQIHITKFSKFYLLYKNKNTNIHGILRNYDPIRQMHLFCPIIKSFDIEESRPLIIPHESIQPIEVHILEETHKIKYNHKLHNYPKYIA